MKSKINNKNKAKFFAQYWDQKIVSDSILIREDPEYIIEAFEYSDEVFDKLQLKLKSLSAISDEDAISCAKILDPYKKHGDWKQILEVKNGFIDFFDPNFDESRIDNITPFQFTYLSDFLRSRGYLVPWMGLSCEELIEAGWAKYKE